MKKLGIVGGMGPLATVDIYKKITELTFAHQDSEHMHIYIDSNTSIPDRTVAILENGPSPALQMIESAKKLEAMGADFLILACNTAHYFYDEVAASVSIPIINMIEETAHAVKDAGLKKVAILATSGVLESNLYSEALQQRGIATLVPSVQEQKYVMNAIYNCVKANDFSQDPAGFISVLKNLQEEGAEAFLLGCTELPVFFSYFQLDYPIFNSSKILAQKSILFAGYSLIEDFLSHF